MWHFQVFIIMGTCNQGPPKVGASTITKKYVGSRQLPHLGDFFKDHLPPNDFLCGEIKNKKM
jgi:hypothetical protein